MAPSAALQQCGEALALAGLSLIAVGIPEFALGRGPFSGYPFCLGRPCRLSRVPEAASSGTARGRRRTWVFASSNGPARSFAAELVWAQDRLETLGPPGAQLLRHKLPRGAYASRGSGRRGTGPFFRQGVNSAQLSTRGSRTCVCSLRGLAVLLSPHLPFTCPAVHQRLQWIDVRVAMITFVVSPTHYTPLHWFIMRR